MNKPLTFALVGGDLRQTQLAAALVRDGHRVTLSLMEKASPPPGAQPLPPEEALPSADCVLLPLPVLAPNGGLNAPLSPLQTEPGRLLSLVRPGTPVYGGRFPAELLSRARSLGLEAADYYDREELQIANAALTAEGAVQLALEETECALAGAGALVLGYGRIGRLLSRKLSSLGAWVSVAARKTADLAWIRAEGLHPVRFSRLEEALPGQTLLFNTVPAPVLDEARLARLDPGCLCIDLASRPGGTDFEAAARLGRRVLWALSLPGETAPRSAGEAIRDAVYHLLEERETKPWKN